MKHASFHARLIRTAAKAYGPCAAQRDLNRRVHRFRSCGEAGEIRPPMITEIKNAGKHSYWLRLAPVPATLRPSVPLAVPLIPLSIRPAAIVPAPFGLASRRALRRWCGWFAWLALALAFCFTFSWAEDAFGTWAELLVTSARLHVPLPLPG